MSITTIIGPMFSGKTSELIRLIDRQRIASKKCLIIKHTMDTRFQSTSNETHITTHSQICYHKCDIVYLTDIAEDRILNWIVDNYDVVGIDEGFFFKGISKFCNGLANLGIHVIVSTLETSYKQELFGEIGDLMGSSELLIKLTAICMDCKNNEAIFTVRTISSDEEILVGGTDMYKSVCRVCLNK